MTDPSLLDPRVRRTRRGLEEAVLKLAEERDFASITVRDITMLAGINRATFYLHYRDKEDVCARALDTLFDEFTAWDRENGDFPPVLALDAVPEGLILQFRHASERPELYRRLLGEAGSTGFSARLRAYYEEQVLQVWRGMRLEAIAGSPPAELRAKYMASSAHGFFSWWFEHGRTESVETMAAWAWSLAGPLLFNNTVTLSDEEPVILATMGRNQSGG